MVLVWELFGRELHIIAAPNLCSTNSSTSFSTPTFAGPTAVVYLFGRLCCHTLSPSPTPLARVQCHWSTPPTRVGSRRDSDRGPSRPGIWSYSISRSCTAISSLDKHGSVTLLRHFTSGKLSSYEVRAQCLSLSTFTFYHHTTSHCLFVCGALALFLSSGARALISLPQMPTTNIQLQNMANHDSLIDVKNTPKTDIPAEEPITLTGTRRHHGDDPEMEGLTLYEKKALLVNRELNSHGMGKYQWYIFFLCGFGYLIDLLYAQAFGLVEPAIQQEFGFNGMFNSYLLDLLGCAWVCSRFDTDKASGNIFSSFSAGLTAGV